MSTDRSYCLYYSCILLLSKQGYDLCPVHFLDSVQGKLHPCKSTPSFLMHYPSHSDSQNMMFHPQHTSLLSSFYPQQLVQPCRGTTATEARFPDWATSGPMNEITCPMQRTSDTADMPNNHSPSLPVTACHLNNCALTSLRGIVFLILKS